MLFNNTVENSSALARRDLVMQYYREVQPELHPEWLTDDAPMWIWFAARSKMVAIDEPMAVHHVLLGAEVVLLEGVRLSEVTEGVYFLIAAPLNLAGADGAPCRALLIEQSGDGSLIDN